MKIGNSNIYWFVLHLFFGSGFHYCNFSHPTSNQHLSLKCHVKLVLASRGKCNTVEVDGAKEYLDNLTSSLFVELFLLQREVCITLFLYTQLHFGREKVQYDANTW